jgi:hypothetical protein
MNRGAIILLAISISKFGFAGSGTTMEGPPMAPIYSDLVEWLEDGPIAGTGKVLFIPAGGTIQDATFLSKSSLDMDDIDTTVFATTKPTEETMEDSTNYSGPTSPDFIHAFGEDDMIDWLRSGGDPNRLFKYPRAQQYIDAHHPHLGHAIKVYEKAKRTLENEVIRQQIEMGL